MVGTVLLPVRIPAAHGSPGEGRLRPGRFGPAYRGKQLE